MTGDEIRELMLMKKQYATENVEYLRRENNREVSLNILTMRDDQDTIALVSVTCAELKKPIIFSRLLQALMDISAITIVH